MQFVGKIYNETKFITTNLESLCSDCCISVSKEKTWVPSIAYEERQ